MEMTHSSDVAYPSAIKRTFPLSEEKNNATAVLYTHVTALREQHGCMHKALDFPLPRLVGRARTTNAAAAAAAAIFRVTRRRNQLRPPAKRHSQKNVRA